MDKKVDFQKGYKHYVGTWKNNRAKVKQNIKVLIKKLKDENEKFKGSMTRLKSHDEESQDLRSKAEIWETTKRKWTETLFLHKK